MPEFMLVVAMLLGILDTCLFVFVLLSLKSLRESTAELTAQATIANIEPEEKEKTVSEQMEQGIVNILNYKIEDSLKERNHD